jgi:hypothetical protein
MEKLQKYFMSSFCGAVEKELKKAVDPQADWPNNSV